jgi:hypothetical protein
MGPTAGKSAASTVSDDDRIAGQVIVNGSKQAPARFRAPMTS